MSGTEATLSDILTGPVVVQLSKPITVIDTVLSSVTIQPPTGRHLMKAGPVMRMIASEDGAETAVEINPAAMGKLIAQCGNITFQSVETMSMRDFMACSNAVMSFLGGDPTS